MYIYVFEPHVCLVLKENRRGTRHLETGVIDDWHCDLWKEQSVLLPTETPLYHLLCYFKLYYHKLNAYLCIFLFPVLDTQTCRSTYNFQRGSFKCEGHSLKMHTAILLFNLQCTVYGESKNEEEKNATNHVKQYNNISCDFYVQMFWN